MSVTREELAAFADGELGPARADEVAAAVAADPALEAQVEAHRALKARLGAHFAPIMDAPVPESLTRALRPEAEIIDFAAARNRRVVRWSWVAAPALAASLALAVFLPRGGGYVEGPLAEALDHQLVATQAADGDTRVLLSFRSQSGDYCRAFTTNSKGGIACHDDSGWVLTENLLATVEQTGEYRQAGSSAEAIMAQAQAMADGPALDAAGERAAQARGWR